MADDDLRDQISRVETDIEEYAITLEGCRKAILLAKVAIAVPDLMVLDVQMPGIDGYEVCRRLRDDPALDDLRIIMLTSSDDKHAAFEAGVDDYLNKDIDLLNLPNRVKLILEMH